MVNLYVDVFPWIGAIATSPKSEIPMNGRFRHADYWCRQPFGSPAILIKDPHEYAAWMKQATKTLATYLNKRIRVVLADAQHPDKVWLSLGVDQCCPLLRGDIFADTFAILHDTMSAEGIFGPAARERFFHGVNVNNNFLPVTRYALDSFIPLAGTPKNYIDYGNWVSVYLPLHKYRPRFNESCSVGTWFKYKNIGSIITASHALSFSMHSHYGEFFGDMSKVDVAVDYRTDFQVSITTGSDYDIRKKLRSVLGFFCLSSHEGFSLTPLEALSCGVPYLYLSDIPAHREVYAKVSKSINWFSKEDILLPHLVAPSYKVVSHDARIRLLSGFSAESVTKPFLNHLKSL